MYKGKRRVFNYNSDENDYIIYIYIYRRKYYIKPIII